MKHCIAEVKHWNGTGALRKSMQQAKPSLAEGRGLHDSLADPEIAKHVSITSKLADLLGVGNADQVNMVFCGVSMLSISIPAFGCR